MVGIRSTVAAFVEQTAGRGSRLLGRDDLVAFSDLFHSSIKSICAVIYLQHFAPQWYCMCVQSIDHLIR